MGASQKLVLITGASGFIGLHCVKAALLAGYQVIGTVRTPDKEQRVRTALKDVPGRERLRFAYLNLQSDEGWAEAFHGVDYVLHTASPVPNRPPENRDDIITPALEGVGRALRFSKEAGVRRMVLTSSVAAVVSGQERTEGRTFDEEDWSRIDDESPAYDASKTLGEQAAWQFAESEGLELAVINPVYVLGPSLGEVDNASNEIVRKAIDREMPGVPRVMLPVVDVRDVAEAHLAAMTQENAAGKRFILCAHHPWFIDIMRDLKELGHRVPRRELPDWLVHMASWFDPILRLITDDLGKETRFHTTRAKEILGFSPRPLNETLKETVDSILARRPASA